MKPFLAPFRGIISDVPPCWFMRQAGRYLPEYRDLREKSGDFLVMCYTPDIASEITLQPIRRFGMDAAIIFSDILVVPHGLGQSLEFIKGHGPKLEPLTEQSELGQLDTDQMRNFLQPVYEAIAKTKTLLDSNTALIGFAGAPWTLLCYMIDGHGKQEFIQARTALYEKPAFIASLLELLVDAVSRHLIAQIEAGADAVQLFDSWASYAPAPLRQQLIMEPAARIVRQVKAACPDTPVICFPRAIGVQDMIRFAETVKPDGLSVDQFTDISTLKEMIASDIVLQGNLDPLALMVSQDAICSQAKLVKQQMRERRFVMNLGHGVLPPTPPAHMEALIQTLRNQL